jgi:hypothetical protein
MSDEFDLEKHIETYLLGLHATLWGRTFDIKNNDLKLAREFIIDLLIDLGFTHSQIDNPEVSFKEKIKSIGVHTANLKRDH